MIIIASYLKESDEFIRISDFEGRIGDSNYIEGAIELQIGSKFILNKEMWDYIDQLWSYIVNGLNELSYGNEYFTYFPDQPIKLVMRPAQTGRLINIEVHCGDHHIQANATRTEFMTTMLNEAHGFFVRMIQLAPENRTSYELVLNQIASLRTR